MTIEDFLPRLDAVRRTSRGYVAPCPAHRDKNPSLAISEGENGRILVHDFGGCTPGEIVAALGLELRDLFSDAAQPPGDRPRSKPVKRDRVALAFQFDLAALDRRLRAEKILETAKGLDLSTLNDTELDHALRHVGQAYTDVDRAELFEHVADTLRERDFIERTSCERHIRVA